MSTQNERQAVMAVIATCRDQLCDIDDATDEVIDIVRAPLLSRIAELEKQVAEFANYTESAMTNPLTQDELIKMAKQAGFTVYQTHEYIGAEWPSGGVCITEEITKFAQLIQQHHIVDANKMVEPTSQESRQVEQGGDELVEAVERLLHLKDNPVSVPLYLFSKKEEEIVQEIRQALANRRGGE